MEPLTTDAVAARAGTSPALVQRLVDGGVLQPDADGRLGDVDVRKVRLLLGLDAAGLPLDAVSEAIRRGAISIDFVGQPSYDRFAGLADETFRLASEREGVPLDLALAIREAMGSAHPEPDDRMRSVELDVLAMLGHQLRHGVRATSAERSLRTAGDGLRRIAETEADWWWTDILGPLFAAGRSVHEIGELSAAFADSIGEITDRALLAMYHGQQSNAWLKNIFEGFEGALEAAGLHRPTEHPPAICFLDLSGYSRLTEERGDAAAAELAARLARLVQRTSARHGGRPVKWLGDGVMFHFREPGPAVVAALEMVEGAARAGLPPAHVGLHAGPVLFQEGDYFGRTVNLASRIADYARGSEVLVTDEVVAAASATGGISFEAIGRVELKGMAGTISLHAARRAG